MDATIHVLLALSGSLAQLSGHPDVDALVERVVASARGIEGLSAHDARRLHRWADRWARVSVDVRGFYARALADRDRLAAPDLAAAERGVRCLLDGYPATGETRGRLHRLHLDLLGHEPGRDLTR